MQLFKYQWPSLSKNQLQRWAKKIAENCRKVLLSWLSAPFSGYVSVLKTPPPTFHSLAVSSAILMSAWPSRSGEAF